MSKMANMVLDIQDDIADGILSFGAIAERYNISRADVELIADEMMEQYNESCQEEYNNSMDGDHDSAMASAGFGTDEDYGYYGED